MEPLLLILILLAGPDDQPIAESLAEVISREQQVQVQVHIGKEAGVQLAQFGVKRADLVASPSIAVHLTKATPKVVIIDVDQREVGVGAVKDHLVESQLWIAGKYEVFTAIAGEGGDPEMAFINGMMPLIRPLITADAQQQSPVVQRSLATLVDRKEWKEVLLRLAEQDGPQEPIEYFYQVTAYSRLNNRQAALEALNAMREAHGGHFLVTAAQEALPPAEEAPAPDANETDLSQ